MGNGKWEKGPELENSHGIIHHCSAHMVKARLWSQEASAMEIPLTVCKSLTSRLTMLNSSPSFSVRDTPTLVPGPPGVVKTILLLLVVSRNTVYVTLLNS